MECGGDDGTGYVLVILHLWNSPCSDRIDRMRYEPAHEWLVMGMRLMCLPGLGRLMGLLDR